MEHARQSLVGVWSMYEAQRDNVSIDEVYVFSDGNLGACLYSNPVADDLELFRWTCDAERLTFEPLRSVWIARENGSAEQRAGGVASAVRFTIAFERDAWDRDACLLRMDPNRGVGARYAKSLLSERQREALQRHLGLELGPELVAPLRQQTW